MKPTLKAIGALGGGATLALVPAVSLIIATKLFAIEEQGFLSVVITFATFVGLLTTAWLVEAQLADVGRKGTLRVPSWLIVANGAAALALVFWPTSVWVLAIALPVFFSAMEAGRAAALADRRDSRETLASITIGVVAVGSLGLAFIGFAGAFAVLGAGVFIATLLRSVGVPASSSRPSPKILIWVLADIGVTAAIFPILNAAIMANLGAESAVAFAAVSTVSAIVGLPLSFLRMRLLSEHSVSDIWLSVVAILGAVLVILLANYFGLFAELFGQSWNNSASLGAILLACAWRGVALLTVLPFAQLRRQGQARLVTLVRVFSVSITFVLAVGILRFDSISLVFGALVVGELIQWITFAVVKRRTQST